jgi:hypothetical protein
VPLLLGLLLLGLWALLPLPLLVVWALSPSQQSQELPGGRGRAQQGLQDREKKLVQCAQQEAAANSTGISHVTIGITQVADRCTPVLLQNLRVSGTKPVRNSFINNTSAVCHP